jgi:predicted Zn-dependent protease
VSAPGSDAPIAHEAARRAAGYALAQPGADCVEVVIAASRTGLTRYARSEIIQNTARDETRAYVRVVSGDKLATATTNQLDSEHMSAAAARALEASRASRPDADWPGPAAPGEVGRATPLFRWHEPTAASSARERAEAVAGILRTTSGHDAAGIYETSAHAYSVFSSTGIDCYDAHTRCVVTCLVDTGRGTGWGEASSHASDDVDVEAAARRAVTKAEAGAPSADVRPGAYEVVLEPAAVATLLEYLSYMGFGAKQVIEGESFLASRSGQEVAARAITVADDVAHPASVGIAFDFEGVPKKRVAVIDRGTATGPVTDLRTARKLGTASSGHFSGSNEFGPYASNLVMEAGDADTEELVGAVSTGLLVTRFHYVNVLDRPATLLTGMTRDGTYRIRGGEQAEPVRNLRFTQSVLDALASTEDVGRELTAFAPEFGSFGSTAAPGARLGEFNFTSTTSH